jgi:two-component system chemotaxis response regulator CheV
MNQQFESKENFDIQASVDYMTKSHLRNVMQLAIFYTLKDKLYAINISKIQSFVIKDSVKISKTPSSNELVAGVINLRGEVITIVRFDSWIGDDVGDDEYRIIIICNYNERKVGILVKDILKIEEKHSDELRLPSSKDPKISYVTDIETVGNKTELCIVFDAEKLLYDINKDFTEEGTTIYDIDSIGKVQKLFSDKLLLVAEDSTIVMEKLNEFFKKIGIRYEIFNNGQKLLDRLAKLDLDEIGLVITDIEMPIKNGYQVIKHIKKDTPSFSELPIIALTSMTNQGVYDKVTSLGALDLVNKADLTTLYNYIEKFLKD